MTSDSESASAVAQQPAIAPSGRPKPISSQATTAALPIGAAAVACLTLVAPVFWNRYPLLQYDTGGYLARWYEGYLVPSRSTVFGLYLHAGEGLHFWPEVLIQSVLTVWIIYLALRTFGVYRPLRLLGVVAALALLTTLPWLTSILLTDIFAGLSVLALHLLLFHSTDLRWWEKPALFAVVAFAVATHSATMATLLAIVAAAAVAAYWIIPGLVATRRLVVAVAALATGALMLMSTNYALSGRFVWTPGGYGIVFGRMLQDGIVARFLKDHCPSPHYKLCPYRNELPRTADEFLWGYGVFNDLGRFAGLGDEMRDIALRSLADYPVEQISTALTATAKQLVMVGSGWGVHNQIFHTYGIIKRYIAGEVPAMQAARQQRGELRFDDLNRFQVPVGVISTFLLPLLMLRLARDRRDQIGLLAASAAVAILANAFVCGALSGPHDRYGARTAWIATFVLVLAGIRLLARQVPARSAAAIGASPAGTA